MAEFDSDFDTKTLKKNLRSRWRDTAADPVCDCLFRLYLTQHIFSKTASSPMQTLQLISQVDQDGLLHIPLPNSEKLIRHNGQSRGCPATSIASS